MKITYVSAGNIPSRYAHTVHIAKMSAGFADHADRVSLVTAGALFRTGPRIRIHQWYDIPESVNVVRLPVKLHLPSIQTSLTGDWYHRLALGYVRWTRPDLVVTRLSGIAKRCARGGIPVVFEKHEPDSLSGIARCHELSSPYFRGVVTVTEYLRNLVPGIPDEKMLVWPDAIDLRPFRNLPSRQEARNRLGLPVDQSIVMYCGHLYDEKGVHVLVDAARERPDALFCLVGGWDSDIERLRTYSAGASNVRFLGHVSPREVPRHLAAADTLVLPNSAKYEQAFTTSPLKLFDYMAAGRAIVAARIPALEGFLEHGKTAYLVDPDSPGALASAVRTVLDDPQLAEQMAERAREKVEEYTWSRRAKAILDAFVHV